MKDKALSLIELVVSLAITMIISATVLVSFTIIDRRKLETTARNLLADLSWAREMAVAEHQNYIIDFEINFSGTKDRYTIYRGSVASSNMKKRQELTVQLNSVTNFSGTPVSPTQITFNYPSGVAQDIIANLNSGGRTRPIRVFGGTGFIRLDPVS